MNRTFFIILLSTILRAGTSSASAVSTDSVPMRTPASIENIRPNVIVVLSDDQGYGDFSCHGNPVLKTPALDRLYAESIRFSNFHVSPLCTPSRGQLMSGLDALHNKASTVGAGRGVMRRDIAIMPEVFKQNGYSTGLFGKWHLGDNYPDRPVDRGFQKAVWVKGWGLLSETEYDNDYYKTRYLDGLEPKSSDKYCTDLWFDKGIEWMDEMCEKRQPFFTYLALNAPHGPFHAPKKDVQFYQGHVEKGSVASFFGMIKNIDQNMDKLDQWLEKRKIKDNTIVIFMNDNGGTGGISVYNAGMKGEKGSTYDGGHRAACFLRWPNGNFGEARTVGDAAQVQDLLPTFIDLLHLQVKGQNHFDGESLRPVLEDQRMSDRMFVVQYTEDERPQKYSGCVVWNTWRLVGRNELYDIHTDIGQQHNIAAAHPEVLQKMLGFYEKWWSGITPEIDRLVPVIIGSEGENPTTLISNDWTNGYVNTQWAVAQASGNADGGLWHIKAEKAGKYQLELSRWPFHLNRSLIVAGPEKAVGGSILRTGRALPIEFGCIAVDGKQPMIAKGAADAVAIQMEISIDAGDHTVQAWFKDKSSKDLCGAYYVRVKKL
jgi:arylsulfatase